MVVTVSWRPFFVPWPSLSCQENVFGLQLGARWAPGTILSTVTWNRNCILSWACMWGKNEMVSLLCFDRNSGWNTWQLLDICNMLANLRMKSLIILVAIGLEEWWHPSCNPSFSRVQGNLTDYPRENFSQLLSIGTFKLLQYSNWLSPAHTFIDVS